MASTSTAAPIMSSQQFLDHWQGHRALTRRVIDAFPDHLGVGSRLDADATSSNVAMTLPPTSDAQSESGANRLSPRRADVTLRVPAQLQSFDPATTEAKISCTAAVTGNPSENRVEASKDTVINLTNGAFSGTVPLTLSVAQPGEQWRYSRNFRLFNSQLNSWDPTMTEA